MTTVAKSKSKRPSRVAEAYAIWDAINKGDKKAAKKTVEPEGKTTAKPARSTAGKPKKAKP